MNVINFMLSLGSTDKHTEITKTNTYTIPAIPTAETQFHLVHSERLNKSKSSVILNESDLSHYLENGILRSHTIYNYTIFKFKNPRWYW